MKRSDVTVELTYWTYGSNAVFVLRSLHGETIQEVSGVSCWHPATRYMPEADGTYARPEGPDYMIAKIHGIVDVMEHDKTPGIFRMSGLFARRRTRLSAANADARLLDD